MDESKVTRFQRVRQFTNTEYPWLKPLEWITGVICVPGFILSAYWETVPSMWIFFGAAFVVFCISQITRGIGNDKFDKTFK